MEDRKKLFSDLKKYYFIHHKEPNHSTEKGFANENAANGPVLQSMGFRSRFRPMDLNPRRA